MAETKDLPKPETELPKPEKDLPLPEKELESQNLKTMQPTSQNKKADSSQDKKTSEKAKWILALILFAVLFFLIAVSGYLFLGMNSKSTSELPTAPEEEQTFCTQEAKLCPDGSTYVGREGPNCEFAQCPDYEPEDEDIDITPVNEEFEDVVEITEEPLPTAEISETTTETTP